MSSIEERAAAAAGNWKRFDCFSWHARPDEPEASRWCIVYTSSRDSDVLEESNAAVIKEMMAPFCERGTAREESHSHWAVGHVDGFAIRVYTSKGRITRAFRKWCEIQDALDDYPVLDEDDFCQREHDEFIDRLKCDGWRKVPEGLQEEAFDDVASKLADQYGYAEADTSEEAVRDALLDLGYTVPCPLCGGTGEPPPADRYTKKVRSRYAKAVRLCHKRGITWRDRRRPVLLRLERVKRRVERAALHFCPRCGGEGAVVNEPS